MTIKVFDIFSGSGGYSLGFEQSGMKTVAFCEYEEYAKKVLKKNWKDVPIYGDVRDVSSTTLKNDGIEFDLICGGFPCFAKGTRIITSSGLVPIEELEIGDMVLTHKDRFRPVIQKMNRKSDHSIRMKVMGAPDIVTTDEHPFLCKKTKSSSIEWVNAKDLDTSMYLALPNTNPAGVQNTNDIVLKMPYLIGRWLGDGWVVRYKRSGRKNSYATRVHWCSSFKEYDEMISHFDSVDYKISIDKTKTGYKYVKQDQKLGEILNDFGNGAKNKHIPEWVFYMPRQWKIDFINGYFDSDGHEINGDMCFSTISIGLSIGIARLLRDVYDKVARVHSNKNAPTKVIDGRTVNQSDVSYKIVLPKDTDKPQTFFDGGYWWVPIRKKEYESGIQVFNVGVEEDESYTANGVVCHNCQDISIAGKNKGLLEGERSVLWREFRRLIDETKPKYAVIENVSALLSRGLNIILQDLAEIGYDATWTVLDSQYFGLPQRRRRVYILAVRDGIPDGTDIFRFVQRSDATVKQKTLHIENRRQWNFEQGEEGEYSFAYFTRQRSDQFDCKGVASTIMKRDYKDFTDLVLDEGGLRRLAVNERLALQGYPVDFFDGCELTNMQSYMLNGMSVPVVKWLGENIIQYDNFINGSGSITTYEKNNTLDSFFV